MNVKQGSKKVRIGIDVGGTFTDIVISTPSNVFSAKVLNTPGNTIESIVGGVSNLGVNFNNVHEIIHGTMLGTNLLIERKRETVPRPAFLPRKALEISWRFNDKIKQEKQRWEAK